MVIPLKELTDPQTIRGRDIEVPTQNSRLNGYWRAVKEVTRSTQRKNRKDFTKSEFSVTSSKTGHISSQFCIWWLFDSGLKLGINV